MQDGVISMITNNPLYNFGDAYLKSIQRGPLGVFLGTVPRTINNIMRRWDSLSRRSQSNKQKHNYYQDDDDEYYDDYYQS